MPAIETEANEPTPDHWPTEIGAQMAAAHRIYLGDEETADTRLFELLTLVKGLGEAH